MYESNILIANLDWASGLAYKDINRGEAYLELPAGILNGSLNKVSKKVVNSSPFLGLLINAANSSNGVDKLIGYNVLFVPVINEPNGLVSNKTDNSDILSIVLPYILYISFGLSWSITFKKLCKGFLPKTKF